MALPCRQSTARTVTVGPVLDADGVAVTGSVVGDFKIAKNGGAPAALNGSATLTHRHTGNYSLALTASDLDTVGTAEVTCDDTTNACPNKELIVIEEAVYDAFYAASAPGYVANAPVNVAQFGGSNGTFASGRPEVNTTHIAGSAVSTSAAQIGVNVVNAGGTAWGSGAITAASIATNAIDADALAADAVAEIQSGLGTSSNQSTIITHLTDIKGAGWTTTDTLEAIRDKETDIETDTQDIQSRLPAALVSGRIDSSVGAMAANVLTASALATDAVGEIADGVWDEDMAGHSTSNTSGKILQDIAADCSSVKASTSAIETILSGITSLAQWLGLIAGKQTGNSTARTELRATGAGSGTYDETTDSLEANRDNIGTAGAGLTEAGGTGDHLTAIPWNASWDAEVQSEVQDALEANNLDHLAGTSTGIPSVPAGTFLDQIMDDGTASYDRTTDSLQAIRDRGDAAWTGGGGGDATLANQEVIIGLIGSGTISTSSPVDPATNQVYIVRNATYDGVAKPKLAWTVAKNYTGWTGLFTVRHRDSDTVLIQESVTVTSSVLLNVTLDSDATALTALVIEEEFGPHPYDLQMDNGAGAVDVLGPYQAVLYDDVTG